MPEPTTAPPTVGLEEVTNGIGPVVVVQERRLPPFEQDPLPVVQRLPQERSRVRDHRPYKLLEGEQPGGDVGDLVVLLAVDVLEDRVLLPSAALSLVFKMPSSKISWTRMP